MVDLVDGAVEERPVEDAVEGVVPCILDDEEYSDLVGHGVERWEGDGSREAEELGHGVEEPGELGVSLEVLRLFREVWIGLVWDLGTRHTISEEARR